MTKNQVNKMLEENLFTPLADIEFREFRNKTDVSFANNLSRTMVCFHKKEQYRDPAHAHA